MYYTVNILTVEVRSSVVFEDENLGGGGRGGGTFWAGIAAVILSAIMIRRLTVELILQRKHRKH